MEQKRTGLGIYIHVPFCASKCGYCDFYSRVRQDQRTGYLNALVQEIARRKENDLHAETAFFGGGTPSLLTPDEIGRILEAVDKAFPIDRDAEITLEANPETVDPHSLRAMRELGINRLSFGVQTADGRELRALGRRHTFARAVKAVSDARAAGFLNVSLDLMLGIPYQTAESLSATLEKILALSPEHLSCYLLKIEEGTPFYRQGAGKLCASDDETADFYLQVCATLRTAGYRHYEISNFSLPGFESRHNLKYWRDEPYLGFGPAAHSCFGGRRFYNPANLDRYLQTDGDCVESEETDGFAEVESAQERLMLALRLEEGANLAEIAREDPRFDSAHQQAFLRRAEPFARAGLLHIDGNRVALSEKGMLVSNQLLAELL